MQWSGCLLKTIQTLTLHTTIKLFIKDDSNSHSMYWSSCLSKTIQTFKFHAMIWLNIRDDSNSHTPCIDLAVYQKPFKLSHSRSGWVEAVVAQRSEFVLYSWISGQPVERSKMRIEIYDQSWEFSGQGEQRCFKLFVGCSRRTEDSHTGEVQCRTISYNNETF